MDNWLNWNEINTQLDKIGARIKSISFTLEWIEEPLIARRKASDEQAPATLPQEGEAVATVIFQTDEERPSSYIETIDGVVQEEGPLIYGDEEGESDGEPQA